MTKEEKENKIRAKERKSFNEWLRESDEDHSLKSIMFKTYNDMENHEKNLEKHIEQLKKDTIYTLSWSNEFIKGAASAHIARHVIDWFEKGLHVDFMRSLIYREMMKSSHEITSRSTSQIHNIVKDAEHSAWIKIFEDLNPDAFEYDIDKSKDESEPGPV